MFFIHPGRLPKVVQYPNDEANFTRIYFWQMKCTGGKTLLGWVANTILGNMFNLFYLLISTSQKKNKICVKPATSNSTTSNIITTLK